MVMQTLVYVIHVRCIFSHPTHFVTPMDSLSLSLIVWTFGSPWDQKAECYPAFPLDSLDPEWVSWTGQRAFVPRSLLSYPDHPYPFLPIQGYSFLVKMLPICHQDFQECLASFDQVQLFVLLVLRTRYPVLLNTSVSCQLSLVKGSSSVEHRFYLIFFGTRSSCPILRDFVDLKPSQACICGNLESATLSLIHPVLALLFLVMSSRLLILRCCSRIEQFALNTALPLLVEQYALDIALCALGCKPYTLVIITETQPSERHIDRIYSCIACY